MEKQYRDYNLKKKGTEIIKFGLVALNAELKNIENKRFYVEICIISS